MLRYIFGAFGIFLPPILWFTSREYFFDTETEMWLYLLWVLMGGFLVDVNETLAKAWIPSLLWGPVSFAIGYWLDNRKKSKTGYGEINKTK